MVRGRIDALRTAIDITRGQISLTSSFEDLTEDTALNRVLSTAARKIARNSLLSPDLRRRGRRASYHIAAPSPMAARDLEFEPDRISARYVDAIALARLVLADVGTSLENGPNVGTSFLLPTPLIVESALRRIVSDALAPSVSVGRGRIRLAGTQMTINPDLDFGRLAVGDVKYKLWDGSWNRADLYQLVAFATAFDRTEAIHVGFGGPPPTNPLAVGNIRVWRAAWNSVDDLSPVEAATALVAQVQNCWREIENAARPLESPTSW